MEYDLIIQQEYEHPNLQVCRYWYTSADAVPGLARVLEPSFSAEQPQYLVVSWDGLGRKTGIVPPSFRGSALCMNGAVQLRRIREGIFILPRIYHVRERLNSPLAGGLS